MDHMIAFFSQGDSQPDWSETALYIVGNEITHKINHIWKKNRNSGPLNSWGQRNPNRISPMYSCFHSRHPSGIVARISFLAAYSWFPYCAWLICISNELEPLKDYSWIMKLVTGEMKIGWKSWVWDLLYLERAFLICHRWIISYSITNILFNYKEKKLIKNWTKFVPSKCSSATPLGIVILVPAIAFTINDCLAIEANLDRSWHELEINVQALKSYE